MCRPIRALTEARGYATGKHMYAFFLFLLSKYMLTESMLNDDRLASFGGAGGQHACEIARLLGIKTILIHRYSSILSAYGLALADRYVAISFKTSFKLKIRSRTLVVRTNYKNLVRHSILHKMCLSFSHGSTS